MIAYTEMKRTVRSASSETLSNQRENLYLRFGFWSDIFEPFFKI